jgi:hypothetical protein
MANFTERSKMISMSIESGTDENHTITAPTGSCTVTNRFGNGESRDQGDRGGGAVEEQW